MVQVTPLSGFGTLEQRHQSTPALGTNTGYCFLPGHRMERSWPLGARKDKYVIVPWTFRDFFCFFFFTKGMFMGPSYRKAGWPYAGWPQTVDYLAVMATAPPVCLARHNCFFFSFLVCSVVLFSSDPECRFLASGSKVEH